MCAVYSVCNLILKVMLIYCFYLELNANSLATSSALSSTNYNQKTWFDSY